MGNHPPTNQKGREKMQINARIKYLDTQIDITDIRTIVDKSLMGRDEYGDLFAHAINTLIRAREIVTTEKDEDGDVHTTHTTRYHLIGTGDECGDDGLSYHWHIVKLNKGQIVGEDNGYTNLCQLRTALVRWMVSTE